MLSQLVEPDARVYVLMWYQVRTSSEPSIFPILTRSSNQVLGFLGTACGNLVSGTLLTYLEESGRPLVECYRAIFIIYGIVAALKIVLSLVMTTREFSPGLM